MPLIVCASCDKEQEFHEDEAEAAEQGEAFCLDCQMEIASNGFFMGLIGGDNDELVAEVIGEEDE